MNRIPGVVLLALLAVACSDHSEQQVQRTDTIASLQEELRIDGTVHEFVPVGRVAVREDGTIAIIQTRDRGVRFFGTDGEPLGRFGRSGQGPGEFGSMSELGWRADTLWVYDPSQRRFTFVSPALELGRIVSSPMSGARAIEPGDSLIALESIEQVTRLVHVQPDGSESRTLLLLPEGEGAELRVPGVGVAYSLPFANLPQYRYEPNAGLAAFVMADLEGPDAGTYRITAVSVAGDTAYSLKYAFEGNPIPSDSAEQVVQRRLNAYRQIQPELAAAVERSIRVPPIYPPIMNLVVGMDGSVWIEHRLQDERRPYDVIAPGGAMVGRVFLPQSSRVAAATVDRIWTTDLDEFDVPSIVRYSVLWP